MAGIDANTILCLHMNDVGLTDSSLSPKTPTLIGNVARTNAQSVFGGFSAVFDGNGDVLQFADHADWALWKTIDFRIRFADLSEGTTQEIFTQVGGPTERQRCEMGVTLGQVDINYQMDTAATNVTVDQPNSGILVDTWYHIAIIKGWGGNANDWAITLNGSAIATVTDADAIGNFAAPFELGRYGGGLNIRYLNGFIDEFRVSKATEWTTTFTPPVAAYSVDSATKSSNLSMMGVG